MKNRFLRSDLKKKANSTFGRLIALTGARQTGKTTLLKHEFEEYQYVSFDDPVTRTQYLNLSAEQWYQNYPKAILDEVQKAPKIIETVKAVYDTYEDARYILSGSSQILLMDNIRESLAGRIAIFEISPLTLPELKTRAWSEAINSSRFQFFLQSSASDFGVFNGIPLADKAYCENIFDFEKYLQYGGMPSLSGPNIDDREKDDWLDDYISTYLQRDVRDIGNVRELEPFVNAQKIAAALTGQILNYNSIAKLAAISPKTALRFISYLSISYQVFLLKPWFRNTNKRLSKSPKLHFVDPGIQRRLLARKGELTGNEFESAVVSEIHKQITSKRIDADLYHLRTVDGREVDLLIELDQGFIPIEIKQSEHVSENDSRHLRDLESILDKPVIHSFILSKDSEIKKFSENITALPAVWFLGAMR